MPCASDLCLQGHAPCPTPMQCSGAAQLVDESIDHFRLHRLQDVRPTVYLAPGVIEGPDLEDFLKQDTCLAAAVRWYVLPLLVIALVCGAAAYVAHALGWLA